MSKKSEVKDIDGNGFFLRFQHSVPHANKTPITPLHVVRDAIRAGKDSILHVTLSVVAFPLVALGVAVIGALTFPDTEGVGSMVRLIAFSLTLIWLAYMFYIVQVKALQLDLPTNPFIVMVRLTYWRYLGSMIILLISFALLAAFIFSGLYTGWSGLMEMHGIRIDHLFGIDYKPICIVATIITTIFIFVRFCLVLPLVLKGDKMSMFQSWAMMKSNTVHIVPALAMCLFPANILGLALRTIWEPQIGWNASYISYALISFLIVIIQIIAVAVVPAVFYRLNSENWDNAA